MNFQLFGNDKAPTDYPTRTSSLGTPTLLLIPGLGVSYEIFPGMNHRLLLINHPEEIAQRITMLLIHTSHKQ